MKQVPSLSGIRASFQVYFHGFVVFLMQEWCSVAIVEIWEIKPGRKGSAAGWIAEFLMPKDLSPFAKALLGMSHGMGQQGLPGSSAWETG